VSILASASITIRTDDEIKRQASAVFAQLGMDMSTGINVLLRAIVRDQGFSFPITLEPDAEYREWMKRELQKSWEERSDPNTKWYSMDEFKARHHL